MPRLSSLLSHGAAFCGGVAWCLFLFGHGRAALEGLTGALLVAACARWVARDIARRFGLAVPEKRGTDAP
jgi:hypothetical protein